MGWFSLVHDTPLAAIAATEPCFLDIIHRPFFDHRLSALARLDFLNHHYTYFYKIFDSYLAQQVMQGDGWHLGSLVAEHETRFDIVLRRIGQFDKEGGQSLVFMHANHAVLILTFSFAVVNASLGIYIGGIQGGQDSKATIRQATHDMHGLQPRLLLINVLREMARYLGVEAIYAVNQDNHVYKSDRYVDRKNIQIDYDELWTMAQGQPQANGYFNIPVDCTAKSLEDRAPRKRAQYRRRQAMMDSFTATLKNNLLRLKTPT